MTVVSALSAQTTTTRQLREDLRIVDQNELWTRIGAVALADDGRLAVAFPVDGKVRIFSPKGAQLAEFGRRGEGPGEYQALDLIAWKGDSLKLVDITLRRITVTASDGKVGRSYGYPDKTKMSPADQQLVDGFSRLTPLAVLPNDAVLFLASPKRAGPGGAPVNAAHRDANAILQIGGPTPPRTVRWLPPDNCMIWYDAPSGRGAVAVPLCQRPMLKADPSSGMFAIASVAKPLGTSSRYSLGVFGGSTAANVSNEIAFTPVAPPRDSIVKALSQPNRLTGSFLDQKLKAVRSAGLPGNFPPVQGILMSKDGVPWVEIWHTGNGSIWETRGSRGELLERRAVPVGVTLLTANGSHAWGVLRNDEGIESLVRYALK